MKRILFIFYFLSQSGAIYSQSALSAIQSGQDVNVLYRNERTFGFFVHSRGFGAEFKRLKHVTGKSKRFIEFQLLNLRHPKEIKLKMEGKGGNKGFYYGKLTNVFISRVGLGFQKTLYERAERKSVEVRMNYSLGSSIAFQKPVYLYIFKENYFDPIIERYNPAEHNLTNISGRAPFVYGLNNLTVNPGAYAKLGFSFEFADYSNEVKAVETGIIADVFPLGMQMMADNPKEFATVTLYVSFYLGKKWF